MASKSEVTGRRAATASSTVLRSSESSKSSKSSAWIGSTAAQGSAEGDIWAGGIGGIEGAP